MYTYINMNAYKQIVFLINKTNHLSIYTHMYTCLCCFVNNENVLEKESIKHNKRATTIYEKEITNSDRLEWGGS